MNKNTGIYGEKHKGHVLGFGNNVNKSKFYSGRNYEQIEVRECLLLFGEESFVFQFAIQKFKDQDI